MAVGPDPAAAMTALNRFGFGARGGSSDLARAASDPRGFLKAELAQAGITILSSPTLLPSQLALQQVYAEQLQKKMEREKVGTKSGVDDRGSDTGMAAQSSSAMGGSTTARSLVAPVSKPGMAKEPSVAQKILRVEAMARFRCVAHADVGFAERLVHFWSNHFSVSAAKGPNVRAIAGSFEREAIRPHALGRFADMLWAVERHPAMLAYLDNSQSIGPNSRAGQRRKRGLNENLAREILELHTLGVAGGYTQDDVTSLALIITGWTVAGREGRVGEPGTFVFLPTAHEPTAQTLLGKVYPADGLEQGEAALADLARHPSTASHIARKLAAHFVADDPPASLISRLAKVFRDSDGDLARLAATLIESDEAWSTAGSKMRNPYEFVMAALRAVDRMPDEPGPIIGPLKAMGMPLWEPPGPNGWPDTVGAWASPEGIKSRLEVAAAMSGRIKNLINPSELLDAVAGNAASAETRQAIARAESQQQGLALLLMAPEFQRR